MLLAMKTRQVRVQSGRKFARIWSKKTFQIFEICLGFILGFVFFCIFCYLLDLPTRIQPFVPGDGASLTQKVYDSLLNAARDPENANDSPTVSRRMLSRISPNQFSDPLDLLKELVKQIVSQKENRQEKDFRPRPPDEFFEPTALPEINEHLQPEIFHVLRNFEMLELPNCWQLVPQDVEVLRFAAGDVVVQRGQPIDAIYVVIEGELTIHIRTNRGRDYPVKKITNGGSFFSLLSIIDVLTNKWHRNKLVSLKATTACKVARYKLGSFHESYHARPDAWIRTIQVVITRLHHVTLTTLHAYMGLGAQLMSNSRRNRSLHSVDVSAFESLRAEERHPMACEWFATALGMPGEGTLLADIVTVVDYTKGIVLIKQGSQEEDLIFLLTGTFVMDRQEPEEFEDSDDDSENGDSGGDDRVRVLPGELLPSMQLLTNEPAFLSLVAAEDSTVAVMRKAQFSKFLVAHPQIYLPIAQNVLRYLSPFVRSVDFALNWLRVDSGQAVYRAGDVSDSMFVVLSGRLRSVDKKVVTEEFGRGDVLGMMEMSEKKKRATTVLAVRFSQLASLPEGLLNYIKLKYPQAGVRLLQLLGQCLKSPYINATLPSVPSGISRLEVHHFKNLRTFAIVPACSEVPLSAFTCEFYNALSCHMKVLRLSSTKLQAIFDPGVISKTLDFGLMHYLNVQENSYPLVIYECDFKPSSWTRRCLMQADAIVVVALGSRSEGSQTLAKQLLEANEKVMRTSRELVVLWNAKTPNPSNTATWLKSSYFSGFHHIRCPERMFNWTRPSAEGDVIAFYETHVFGTRDNLSDFARLARIFTGNAVGVVFGGGGARGAAHAGVMRAIRERRIPIDLVGGTSIGAMFSGLYADCTDTRAETRLENWFKNIYFLWRTIFLDLTWAHSALFTGVRFNTSIESEFNGRHIEDLWISYFCVSTDITMSTMRVHRSGLLWPLVRASMSIAGYVPPLCDPLDGHLLLDGAYVNNLPADVMKSLGARVVIAVDVGVPEDTNLTNYGLSLSGFWVLFKKIFPFGAPIRVLNMREIQNRLAYVCCERQLEEVKKAPYCHYFRPPIEHIDPSDFGNFHRTANVGYAYAAEKLTALMAHEPTRTVLLGNVVVPVLDGRNVEPKKPDTFTKMAATISMIPKGVSGVDSVDSAHSSASSSKTSSVERLISERSSVSVQSDLKSQKSPSPPEHP